MNTEDVAGFLAEDYQFTADLLRRYASGVDQDTGLFRAVCSTSLPVILAALDAAAKRKP
jgi:hypothetical protein